MIKKYAWVIWISYKCTVWSIFGPLLCLKFANTLFTHIWKMMRFTRFIWKVSGRSKKCPDHLKNVAGLSKILQNHLLCAFVANLKIDAIYALYPESFCDKNLAIRKVFAFCDSGMLLWGLYEAKNCVQMGGGGYSLAVTSAKQYLTGSFSLLNINLGHLWLWTDHLL